MDDIYDEVAGVKAAKRSDRVTGKEDMQVRERMPLFLPGRIIHLTRDTPRGGLVSYAGWYYWVEGNRDIHFCIRTYST